MRTCTIAILLLFTINCKSQNVYHKVIDVKTISDSLISLIDLKSEFRLTTSFESYWASRIDTTDHLPNLLWNSTLHVFKDSTRFLYYFINPYILVGPEEFHGKAIRFYQLNDSSIAKTEFGSGKVDSIVYKELIAEGTPKELAIQFSKFPNRMTSCSDCGGYHIDLTSPTYNFDLNFNGTVFDPSDRFYGYNSKLTFYTFFLLLQDDLEKISEAARLDLENSNISRLSEEESLKWILEQIPIKIKELEKWEMETKSDLKKLKN